MKKRHKFNFFRLAVFGSLAVFLISTLIVLLPASAYAAGEIYFWSPDPGGPNNREPIITGENGAYPKPVIFEWNGQRDGFFHWRGHQACDKNPVGTPLELKIKEKDYLATTYPTNAEVKQNNDGIGNPCELNLTNPVKIAKDRASAGAAGPGAVGSDGNAAESCEDNGGEMGWLLCAVLRQMDNAVSYLDRQINYLLAVPAGYYSQPKLKETWGSLRNIALLILVPIMLIMVISTALGFDFVSAYTVKKAMPRFLAAVLFITLSWPITVFIVELVNVAGKGIGGLMAGPFGGLDSLTLESLFKPDGVDTGTGVLVGAIGLGGAISAISIMVILSFLATSALGLFVGYVLLVMRQFLVIALMLLAPLAILSWIFPGNDKLWKSWWGTFSKLLLLFPLIIILIAAGRIFARIVQETPGDVAGPDGLAATLIKLIAYVGPYFFIPAMFKFAGGVFATVAGIANDKERGLFDRQKKYRQQKMGENIAKTRNYGRFSDRNSLGRGMNTLLGATSNPRDLARGREGIRAGRRTGRAALGAEALKNDGTFQAHQGDDNFLLALANEDLAEQKLAAARSKFDEARASGDTEKMNAAQAEIAARSAGIGNARRVSSRRSNGTRLAALNQLAKTGYQFAPGEAGYKELSDTVTSITGSDQGAYSSAMNEAQFHLKGAGRLELAGINHGAGVDIKTGIRKLGNYGRGQGKVETYHGGAAAWLGSGTIGADGKTAKTAAEVQSGIMRSLAAGETSHEDIAQWHSMLLRDKESATDANKLEIQKQLNAIDGLAQGYNSGPTPNDPRVLDDRTAFIHTIEANRAQMVRPSIDPSELEKK